jgi:dienelactone hydrolase
MVFSLVTLMMTAADPGPAGQAPAREQVARALVDALSRGDLDAAGKAFDATMAAALPRAKLAAAWSEVQATAGHFQAIQSVREEPVGKYFAVLVGCAFEKGPITVKVVLDGTKQVAGLFFLPGDSAAPWAPPPYADTSRFTEKDVRVGSARLPGTLTLPNGDGPFPAVVLVHGSGPNDRDETLGPNRIFKDLAWGLASRKIATLRYDKRTRVAPAGVKTVKEETLDDASAAAALLRSEPRIDAKHIYVLGHSLGGYLAPWILRENPKLAGAILMAAAARPLMDLVVEQHAYFLSLNPGNADVAKALEEAKRMRARTLAKDLKPDEEVLHAPGAYWLALRDYRPVDTAAQLSVRLLVLQGDRDYQVSPASDFGAFRKALAGKSNATLKSYPSLNHLFEAGEGRSTPDEYNRPGHLDSAVLDDIVAWLRP